MIDRGVYDAAQRIDCAAHNLRRHIVPHVCDDDARRFMEAELRAIDAGAAILLAPADPDALRAADAVHNEGRRDVAALGAIVDDAIAAGLVVGEDIERSQLAIDNLLWQVGRP